MARKVLITAGAAGIGKEIAAAFLFAGDAVYACDNSRAGLDAAAKELCGLRTRVCDIGDREQIEAMVADAATQLGGGIDILVNNTGIAGPAASVQAIDPDQWEAALKIGLTGAFLVTRAAIPHLIASGNGVILIMSSAAGRFGCPSRSPDATVKWGLVGFMKTLAMELGAHNIRANAILPGAMDGERVQPAFQSPTPVSGKSLDEVKAQAMANQSLPYLADPKDIAAVAVFLASDAAKSISGQVVPIDGDLQRN